MRLTVREQHLVFAEHHPPQMLQGQGDGSVRSHFHAGCVKGEVKGIGRRPAASGRASRKLAFEIVKCGLRKRTRIRFVAGVWEITADKQGRAWRCILDVWHKSWIARSPARQ